MQLNSSGSFVFPKKINGKMNRQKARSVSPFIYKELKANHDCFYIIDLDNVSLKIQKGLASFLGYSTNQISLFTLDIGFHQEDKKMVQIIRSTALNYWTKNEMLGSKSTLILIYRQKQQDGSYIKVLSKTSIYEVKNNRISSILIQMTNISFADTLSNISWELGPDKHHKLEFKNAVSRQFTHLYTPREIEIIHHLKSGNTTAEIAEKLFLSHHTIATHRKNILAKTDCHNITELLSFCSERGLV